MRLFVGFVMQGHILSRYEGEKKRERIFFILFIIINIKKEEEYNAYEGTSSKHKIKINKQTSQRNLYNYNNKLFKSFNLRSEA